MPAFSRRGPREDQRRDGRGRRLGRGLLFPGQAPGPGPRRPRRPRRILPMKIGED